MDGGSVLRDPRGVPAMPADRCATDPRELSGQEADLVPALRAAADEVPRVAAHIGTRFAREESRRRAQAILPAQRRPFPPTDHYHPAPTHRTPPPHPPPHPPHLPT